MQPNEKRPVCGGAASPNHLVQHNKNRSNFQAFRKDKLPNPPTYFASEGLRLVGAGEWRSGLCPFHSDKSPSLRVNIKSGGWRCMACGAHGGDVLAFHMMRHQLRFLEAAKALGALEVQP
ncbi:MAG: CHC2 zinc finger domain-containing protein [Alphaproteobacteria bacterium]